MQGKTFILGLTGSIGMGKSTTAGIFADAAVPVWDADAVVHRIYKGDNPAVRGIAELVPDAVKNQIVDRQLLKQAIEETPELLTKIEALVHPLVAKDRMDFLQDASNRGAKLVVIDHPLLFETGGDKLCDAVLAVTAPPEEQRRRVLTREGMTEDIFNMLLARQMPDADKRRRADYVLETSTIQTAKEYISSLISEISISGAQNA